MKNWNKNQWRTWASNKRTRYKEGKMPQEEIEAFEANPNWSWNTKLDLINERLSELSKFKGENGHPNVPKKYPILGRWLARQKSRYKKGTLDKYVLDSLVDLGVSFESKNDRLFKQRVGELDVFIKQNGKYPNKAESAALFGWVARQRKKYKLEELTLEEKRLLDNISFIYEVGNDVRWERVFKEFSETTNPCQRLRSWASAQRRKHKEGLLSKDQISALNKIGFDFITEVPLFIQLTMEGEFVAEWDNLNKAATSVGLTGISRGGNITRVANGIGNSSGGYKWMWKTDYENLKNN